MAATTYLVEYFVAGEIRHVAIQKHDVDLVGQLLEGGSTVVGGENVVAISDPGRIQFREFGLVVDDEDRRLYDILRAVNGAVSSVGVSADLRLAGGNIPVTVDGTRVCALFFGTVRAW